MELAEIGADDIAVEVHHRVERVDKPRGCVGNVGEIDAVVLDEHDAVDAGERCLRKSMFSLLMSTRYSCSASWRSLSLLRPWPAATSTVHVKSAPEIIGQMSARHWYSMAASASS